MTAEEYKVDQKKRIDAYIVGAHDNLNNVITKIFSKGEEYVVYEIKTNYLADSIKVLVDTVIKDNTEPIDNFTAVREKYTKLKGMLYKVVDHTTIKARIGHILAHAITGKPDEANVQFDTLMVEIEQEYVKQSKHRIRYLMTTLFIVLAGIAASVSIYYYDLFNDSLQVRYLVFISTSASIGGFISITRTLRKTVFEQDVSPLLYILYSFERMVIAVVAGVIVYFAIQSNLIFGFVNDFVNPLYGFLTFSVAAGFSETLIPNLLINLEKRGG